jgi:ANTAR domain/GAF domain
MTDTSLGWDEILQTVRRCEHGRPLTEKERQTAVELATSIGLSTTPAMVGCSISLLLPEGHFITPAATGQVALDLDEVQYAADAGPCLSAARRQHPHHVDSMAADERWPGFSRSAVNSGVNSSLSLPLRTVATSAALNLYASEENSFSSERAQALAGVLARATSILLTDAESLPIEGLNSLRVQRTIVDRTLIARAQGVLMAREGLTARLAYRKLAVRSAGESRPLRDVAQQVLRSDGTATDQEVSA